MLTLVYLSYSTTCKMLGCLFYGNTRPYCVILAKASIQASSIRRGFVKCMFSIGSGTDGTLSIFRDQSNVRISRRSCCGPWASRTGAVFNCGQTCALLEWQRIHFLVSHMTTTHRIGQHTKESNLVRVASAGKRLPIPNGQLLLLKRYPNSFRRLRRSITRTLWTRYGLLA